MTLRLREAVGRDRDSRRSRRGACIPVGLVLLVLLTVGASSASASAWSPQFVPMPSGATDSYLNDVSCTSRTNCIAVGAYATKHSEARCGRTGSACVALVERWNGIRWSIQAGPRLTGGSSFALNGVSCTSVTACTAVGLYSTKRSYYDLPLVARWNGKTWLTQSISRATMVGELLGVSCASNTSCATVGHDIGLLWDGRTWSRHRMQPNPDLHGYLDFYGVSCSSDRTCFAVGQEWTDSGEMATIVNRWDGTTWTLQPTLDYGQGLLDVSCASSSACLAVGEASFGFAPLAEAWKGLTWSDESGATLRNAQQFYRFTSVSCTKSSACTAVGDKYETVDSPHSPVAEHWNGTTWALEPVSKPLGAKSMTLNSVSCVSRTVCVATGAFTTRGGSWLSQPFHPLVESTIPPSGGRG